MYFSFALTIFLMFSWISSDARNLRSIIEVDPNCGHYGFGHASRILGKRHANLIDVPWQAVLNLQSDYYVCMIIT